MRKIETTDSGLSMIGNTQRRVRGAVLGALMLAGAVTGIAIASAEDTAPVREVNPVVCEDVVSNVCEVTSTTKATTIPEQSTTTTTGEVTTTTGAVTTTTGEVTTTTGEVTTTTGRPVEPSVPHKTPGGDMEHSG